MSRIRKSVEAMQGYVPGEQPKDPEILKLNTNENPYPPSPKVAEALVGASERFRLYPDPVCMKLREAIAELHGVTVDQVIAGNGSDETLALCTRAFVENNGSIGWLEPSYSLYPILSDIADVETRPVPLTPDFKWAVPDEFESDLFFLTNPNAPTGMMVEKGTLLAFCQRFPGVVVIDEAYADFAPDNCMDLVDQVDNLIVMRTFSKSYGLAGLRVGYAVGAPKLIEAMYKIKDSYNLNLLTQLAAEAAIRDDAYKRATADKIMATRERTAAALRERGWHLEDSHTNFLWAKPPAPATAAQVFAALRKQKIVVRYFPAPATSAFIRITIGTDAQMDRFLAALT